MAEAYPTFGSFVLFKEVLADELGHLYRAGELDREGLKRTVWLRIFDGAQIPSEDLATRVELANQIAETLHATNVVANPVCLEHDGVVALAWDHSSAQPLARVFAVARGEGFPVPVDNALLVLEKLALALSAGLAVEVAGTPLIHGFLHPGLVSVTHDGEALVAGFGLADQLLGLLDVADAAALALPYVAPEVVASRNPTKRSDVYSLGAILFQLITAQPLPAKPEEREGALERAELAYEEGPLPDDIRELLRRSLDARPEERFSSAADFKKELDKLLYGGAYSPTTFNLALFMDRLFRTEIDQEERERSAEEALDVTPYLRPEPEPEPEEPVAEAVVARGGKGLMIGLGAAAVVLVAAVVFFVGQSMRGPQLPPTPTPEEIAAKQAADEERIKQLAAQMVQEQMKEKEAQVVAELQQSQQRIEELNRRLRDTERRAASGQLSSEQQRKRQEIQRQLAAEKEASRKREEELAAERKRAEEQARRQLVASQAATATATAEKAAAVPTATPPPPTRVAERVAPTEAPPTPAPPRPSPAPTARLASTTVKENAFYEPSEVDSLPVVIRDAMVSWPRLALHSRRQGLVVVQATVNAEGRVEAVKVLRADHEGFGIPQAVMEAVRKYQFRPATKNGVNVKTYATVTKRYKFQQR